MRPPSGTIVGDTTNCNWLLELIVGYGANLKVGDDGEHLQETAVLVMFFSESKQKQFPHLLDACILSTEYLNLFSDAAQTRLLWACHYSLHFILVQEATTYDSD